jgi:hypothetical protein
MGRASDSPRGVEVRVVFSRIHLCNGLLERDGRILLVANAYPNHRELLWNLPGGRQDGRETCAMAVVRELREETSLEARVTGLAYVAESFDAESQRSSPPSASRSKPKAKPSCRPAMRTCARAAGYRATNSRRCSRYAWCASRSYGISPIPRNAIPAISMRGLRLHLATSRHR